MGKVIDIYPTTALQRSIITTEKKLKESRENFEKGINEIKDILKEPLVLKKISNPDFELIMQKKNSKPQRRIK